MEPLLFRLHPCPRSGRVTNLPHPPRHPPSVAGTGEDEYNVPHTSYKNENRANCSCGVRLRKAELAQRPSLKWRPGSRHPLAPMQPPTWKLCPEYCDTVGAAYASADRTMPSHAGAHRGAENAPAALPRRVT